MLALKGSKDYIVRMPNKDPLRALSRTVVQSVENSPENSAFRAGLNIVPNTWGAYATRAIDLELCDPTIESVTDLLGGAELVDLNDPDIMFTSTYGFGAYYAAFIAQRTLYYEKDLTIEAKRLNGVVKLITSQWEVDLASSQPEADKLQEMIEESTPQVDLDIICMKRDGLQDGLSVTLAEYAKAMLGANILNDDAPSELAVHWIKGIKDVVNALEEDYLYLDLDDRRIADLHLSRRHVNELTQQINHGVKIEAREKAEVDWDVIGIVFEAPSNLSILDGTES